MKRLKGIFSLLLACSVMAGMAGGTDAYAAVKINSISIKIDAKIEPGSEYGEEEIEVSVKTGNCEYVDYEILNEDNEWGLDSVPIIKIVIESGDNYVFNINSLSKINISGGELVGATRSKGSSGNSNTQLNVTVTLPSLNHYVGEISSATINQDGIASWEPVVGATSYYVRLYRDGSSAGTVTTSKTTYDFSPAMLRSGNYYVRVRAINGVDENNKSEQAESNTISISDQTAAANKENNSSKPGEWLQTENGWWYCHGDGSYTVSDWEKIRGSWYIFDEAGYMRTGWVTLDGKTYYFNPANGAMLSNTTVEGRVLGEDGAMIQ